MPRLFAKKTIVLRLFAIVSFVMQVSCTSQELLVIETGESIAFRPYISVYELVANGQRYDGWELGTIGVFDMDFDGNFLFVNRESLSLFDTSSAIYIDLDSLLEKSGVKEEALFQLSKKYKYVNIVGTYFHSPKVEYSFSKNKNNSGGSITGHVFGHLSSGLIEEVKHIEFFNEYKD